MLKMLLTKYAIYKYKPTHGSKIADSIFRFEETVGHIACLHISLALFWEQIDRQTDRQTTV
jgi:hypothetical protein